MPVEELAVILDEPPPAPPLEDLGTALEKALEVPPGDGGADVPEPVAVPPDWFGTSALLELAPSPAPAFCRSPPPFPDVDPPCDEQAQGTTVAARTTMR
jgi:hypothetical protein